MSTKPDWLKSPRSVLLVLVLIFVLAAVVNWMPSSMARLPVTYRMGHIDEKFAMSPDEAARAVREAAAIWSRAAGRELFRERPGGDVEVRFVYDYRQEASDKLKGMSGAISYNRGSYDALKARYDREEAEFRQKEALLLQDTRVYNSRVAALNAETANVSVQNLPEADYRRLKSEQEELDAIGTDIQLRQQEQRDTADNLNRLATVINEIASSLNLEVVKYRRTGSVLATEFSEGLYERKKGRETITIYHFPSRERLVRVLAHELGHALGLGHNNNPGSIMYRLNQSDSLTPTAEDITSLKDVLGKGLF